VRIAIATEWIDARAGSEQVFEAMSQAFPEADLFALSLEPDVHLDVGDRPIATTWLDRSDLLRRSRAATLPLMPMAWNGLSEESYDLVVTSSHAFARWFRPARSALHLSYVHAPARYLWTPALDARTRTKPWISTVLGAPLRRLDRRSVTWTDEFAANSQAVAARVQQFYGRPARVIHPPVDVETFTPPADDQPKQGGALYVGRFITYKRPDVAIDACARAGIPLTVVGYGPLEDQLRARAAGTSTTFVVRPERAELERLYRDATVLLHPAEEDFGLVPVEAISSGTPVLAFDAGGARDTVTEGVTGHLVPRQTAEAFAAELRERDWSAFRPSELHTHAQRWRRSRFVEQLKNWVEESLASR